MVQPNISWRSAYYAQEGNYLFNKIIDNLNEISLKAQLKNKQNNTLIFPELSITDFTFDKNKIRVYFSKILNPKTYLITGTKYNNRNAVVSINSDYEISGVYHKQKLVPFFETTKYQKSEFNHPIPITKPYHLGVFICYEMLFPSISQNLALAGADILGGIAFNTWLGNTNWPLLQMAYTPFRAIENNRYVFYLNNNGPSIVCNERGIIINSLPSRSRGYISFYPTIISKNRTIYQIAGNWLILISLIIQLFYISIKFSIIGAKK